MGCSPPGSSAHRILPGKNGSWVGCPSLLQGIFPTQGPNPGLLHCRQILYLPCHQGSPCWALRSLFLWNRAGTGLLGASDKEDKGMYMTCSSFLKKQSLQQLPVLRKFTSDHLSQQRRFQTGYKKIYPKESYPLSLPTEKVCDQTTQTVKLNVDRGRKKLAVYFSGPFHVCKICPHWINYGKRSLTLDSYPGWI